MATPFNQGAPTIPVVLNTSNCFVFGNTASGNALSVQQLGTGNVATFRTTTGATALFVNAAGNVGIGTASPQAPLHVSGSIFANGSNNYVRWVSTNGTAFPQGQAVNRYYKIATLSATSDGGGGARLTIKGGLNPGGLGQGIQIDSYVQTRTGFIYGGISLGRSTDVTARVDIVIYLEADSTYSVYLKTFFFFTFDLALSGETTTQGGLIVYQCPLVDTSISTPTGTLQTPSLVVASNTITTTSTGRVGIGTADPQAPLSSFTTRAGFPDTSGSGSSNVAARIQSGSICLDFGSIGGTNPFWIQNHLSTNNATNYPILLNPNGGNVGIGTTSPGYPLHVNGAVNSPSVSVVYFNGGEGTILKTYSGAVNTSIYASSAILAGSSICSISDRRSKIPEEPLSDPYLSFVDKINVHQFSWVDKVEKDSGKKIGFFAQEVKDVLPDAVGRTTGVVPTIYRQAEAFTETTVTFTGHGLTTEKKLEIVDLENGKTKIDIVRVIDADNLEVKFEKVPKDKIFVIGPEVDDLHAVNHDYLMAVGFGGLKELHALVKTQQTTIEMLTERLSALEAKLNSR